MRVNLNILILFFLLLDNLYLPIKLGFDFRLTYVVYFIYIVYTIITNKKIFINKNFIFLSLGFIIGSLFLSLVKESPTLLVIKQAILIYTSFLVSYILLNSYSFNHIKLFKDYIKLIYIAAIVGLIQFVFQQIGFLFGSDYSYLGFEMGYYISDPNARIQSWFYEPSFLVYAFMPVVFLVIARFFSLTNLISLKKGTIILLTFLLSRSAIGFLGLLLAILMIVSYKYSFLKRPKTIITVSIFFLIATFYIYHIPEIKFRIDDTVKLFFDKDVSGKDIDKINLSTYALFSNYKITIRTLQSNPLFGTGLGTYEFNYDKYINEVIPKSNFRKYYKINKNDANSMFFRLLAEVGMLGTFFILFLIFKKRIKNNYSLNKLQLTTDYWLISNGIFILILIRLLRQGHYTMLGFTLFLLMYFYANKELNERVKETSH